MRTTPKNIYKNRRKTRKIFGISFLTVKPLEILLFLFIGTLFDRWFSTNSKGEGQRLFAFAIYFVFYAVFEITSE